MPWSESDAIAYMNGSKTFDEVESSKTSQPSEENTESTAGNVEPTATETDKVETSDVKETTEEDKSTGSDDIGNPEKVDKSVENKGNKKKYTPEQKTKHAFQKQKAKFHERLDAKQKEIDELKEKLKKYEGLKKEDFNGDEDAWQDYRLDQRFGKEKVERLQKELNDEQLEQQRAEQAQIAQYRLEQCYPDAEQLEKYQQLVFQAETNFANMHPEIGYKSFSEFLQSEKDGTLISYLQDSDYSPKLINHFIHKPEAALKIMQLRNPLNKIVELKQLENRMQLHERLAAAKAAEPPKEEPRQLPNTGKVVSQNVNEQTSLWDKKAWTEKEALAYIKSKGI